MPISQAPPPRVFVALGLLAVVALAACNRIDTRPLPIPSGPSVVLVTIDTLRADRVGANGGEHAVATPTLDALAARGADFETVFAAAPITLPSHASILTGQSPPRHGVRHNGLFRLAEGTPTLASAFHAAGYETGAVVASLVLAPRFGLAQGFDDYDADVSSKRASSAGFLERPAEEVTDAALAWLGRRTGPFFLWVHYYDPHAVYDPPARFAAQYPDDAYAGEIAYVDAQLGRLIEALRVGGRLDDTLVAVTADHGESLGEHGETTHAYTVYDAVMRVPWIVSGPGVEAGTRIGAVASSIDLAPTLLALAGLPALSDAEGRDFSAALRGGDPPPPRAAYGESLATRLDHGWAPLHALRSEGTLYIRAPRPELYDVREDPRELDNLLVGEPAREQARRVATLEGELDERLAVASGGSAVDLDRDTRSRLQALGYALPEQPVAATGLDPKDGLRLVTPFERAKALYQEGDLDAAEAIAASLLEEFPESPGVHDLVARVHLSHGRGRAAVTQARRALELQPRSVHAQVLLGQALIATGATQEALAAFDAALALDATDATAQACAMWRLLTDGSLDDARQAAERAIALDPKSAEIRVLVADTWDQLGQYDLALARYQEALELAPSTGAAHLGVAVGLARLGDLAQVDRHMRAAGPTGRVIGARMRLAIALAGRGAFEHSERVLQGILDEAPEFQPARAVLARVRKDARRAEHEG